MEQKKLSPLQQLAKSLLDQLKRFFPKDKIISRIYVTNGTQKFWVKDPEKMRYWKSIAEQQASFGFKNDCVARVKILKVIYA